MRSRIEKFSLVIIGAIIGILFTFNLPVFADKNNPNNLPIDKLISAQPSRTEVIIQEAQGKSGQKGDVRKVFRSREVR